MTDTQGATSSKGVRGAMSSDEPQGGHKKIWGDDLFLDILELQMKRKKKVLGIFYAVEGGHRSLNSLKGAICKKKFGKP